MKSTALRRNFPLVFCLGMLSLPALGLADNGPVVSARALADEGLSHVRVVRLSFVSGTVTMRRPGSTAWTVALVNSPLQEGLELSTSQGGYAEVEFENGSTARLGEASKINFEQLAIDAKGNKLNRIAFEQGYGTFHVYLDKSDNFSVKFGSATLTPSNKSLFRTDLDDHRGRIEIFAGSVQAATTLENIKLTKKKVAEFDPTVPQMALAITNGITKDSWDEWASKRDLQAQLSFSPQNQGDLFDDGVNRYPSYGWSDLDAFGEWGYFPGYGYGWSPFAAMGWEPYSMGMWNWYPGSGLTWVSSEPWGWLPYHYGSWTYNPGSGWFWLPTGTGAYSPALVSWYAGPGWIGWTPQGARGIDPRGRMITAQAGMVQYGWQITPNNIRHMPVTAGTKTAQLPFEPAAGAVLPNQGVTNNSRAAVAVHAATLQRSAPANVLMGGNAAMETSLSGRHNEPFRARMGTTLGGQLQVGGTVGEFRGDAFRGQGRSQIGAAPAGSGPSFSRGSGIAPASPPVFGQRGQASQSNSAPSNPGNMGRASSGGNVGGGGGNMGGGGAGVSHGGGSMGGASMGGGGSNPVSRGH